ncbi:hypothetical protein GCM10023165_25080 [Variovorax defluvii]|uniref:Uncharacterized protein n=1 Tax=Variovorax defluvii TaxID=913761 RepID=A0ABP8HR86_9BURK
MIHPKPSLDERIAEAERQIANWSQEERRTLRAQGLDEFKEKMRLANRTDEKKREQQMNS